jgi:hypothetical protein
VRRRVALLVAACAVAGCRGPGPERITCDQVRHDPAQRDAVTSAVYKRLRRSVAFRLAADGPEARDYVRAYVETLCANSRAPKRDRPYRQAVRALRRPELWP